MSDASDKLKNMIDVADEQVTNINGNVEQIQAQIDELQEEDDAIVDGMLNPVADELQTYLNDVKLPDFQAIDSGATLDIGSQYNVIGYNNQLTDWKILDSTAGVMYEYNGIGWDGDMTIIGLIDEWDFGNDYLTRPLTSGASYGVRPYKTNLNNAKGILQSNADKITESKDAFNRFAS